MGVAWRMLKQDSMHLLTAAGRQQGPRPAHSARTLLPLPPRQLFPEIDANHDGVVSAEELQRHLYRNGMTMSHRRADMEFADVDSDHDGVP